MAESSLSKLLADFLRSPTVNIRLSDSEEVQALQKQVEQLQQALHRSELSVTLYASRCLAYEDYLKSMGVRPSEICK